MEESFRLPQMRISLSIVVQVWRWVCASSSGISH